jgi:large subunit ribosomal protein L21
MYAIIECGGKQYRVQEGDRLQVEKIKSEVGSKVMLDQVLLLGGENTVIGTPMVNGAAVSCKVLGHDKEKKILVYHYKAKKNIRKRYGHRQPFTSLLVESIMPSGYVKPVEETIAKPPITKAVKAEVPAAEVEEPIKVKVPAEKPAKKKEEAAASDKPAARKKVAATEEPAAEKPVKKTAAKKAAVETEPAATAEEKPAKKPRAKKTETPEA